MRTSFGWEGKGKYGIWFIPIADERGVCSLNCEIPWECVPYLSALLEVCSRRGTIQIHVYLYTFTFLHSYSNSETPPILNTGRTWLRSAHIRCFQLPRLRTLTEQQSFAIVSLLQRTDTNWRRENRRKRKANKRVISEKPRLSILLSFMWILIGTAHNSHDKWKWKYSSLCCRIQSYRPVNEMVLFQIAAAFSYVQRQLHQIQKYNTYSRRRLLLTHSRRNVSVRASSSQNGLQQKAEHERPHCRTAKIMFICEVTAFGGRC